MVADRGQDRSELLLREGVPTLKMMTLQLGRAVTARCKSARTKLQRP